MSPLYAELNRWRILPHMWGVYDCITLPCDWVKRIHGIDPVEDLRLTYESAAEVERLLRFFSRPLELARPLMARAGLTETPTPQKGDVGIILLPDPRGRSLPHGALCLGSSWAVKCSDGSLHVQTAPEILASWRVNYAP